MSTTKTVVNGGYNYPDWDPLAGDDHKVAANSGDPAPDYLQGKLKDGAHLTWTLDTTGGVRKMRGDVAVPVASDAMPTQDGGTGSPGASSDYSRADHAHQAAPVEDPTVVGSKLYLCAVQNPLLRDPCSYLIVGADGRGAGAVNWDQWTKCSGIGVWQGNYPAPLYGATTVGGLGHLLAIGDRFFVWGSMITVGGVGGLSPQYDGPYELMSQGNGVDSYPVIRRVLDANTPATLCHGMVLQIAADDAYLSGEYFTLTTADPITVDTTALTFTHSSSDPGGVTYDLLTAAQLYQAAPGILQYDTGYSGTEEVSMAHGFTTLAGTPGVNEIPAGPVTLVLGDGIANEIGVAGGTTTVKAYLVDVDNNTLILAFESPPITAPTVQPLTFQGNLASPYAFSITNRLYLNLTVKHSGSGSGNVKLIYSTAARLTYLQLPFALFAPGSDDHQLLTLASRSQDVGAGQAACHPASAIGAGRLHRNIGAGSVASNILTFPADASQCRVTGATELKGITSTGFLDGDPVMFLVTDASPSNVVKITHKATVSAPAKPFWLAPLAGQTAGQSIQLKAPSIVECMVDLSSNCIRLRALPMGSIGT